MDDEIVKPEASDDPRRRSAERTLLIIIGATLGFAGLIAVVTPPVASLLGESRHAIPGALHGMSAILFVITGTIGAYMGYRLFFGRLADLRDLRVIASINACLSLLTVMFGNWIYIYYRAKGGPRSYFLETNPVVHEIFFEFKEFLALFTLPLSVATAYILLREREGLLERRWLPEIVGVLLVIAWGCLMLVFGLGAAITKLRSA
ncbi:MAG: hypothetical protein HYT80_09945 [Euryarchaeota archaeon]|nr:hypothetical protein [Euryarchaeota archaeon]